MINKIKDLQLVNMIGEDKGVFQAIVKVPAGFMVAYEIGTDIPTLNRWKKGSLQTIQFKRENTFTWHTVFAKKGTKVIIMDEKVAERLEVGTVNSLFANTNLYSQEQYRAVGAKTWADKVFVQNVDFELV
jgi:hypothetical protein